MSKKKKVVHGGRREGKIAALKRTIAEAEAQGLIVVPGFRQTSVPEPQPDDPNQVWLRESRSYMRRRVRHKKEGWEGTIVGNDYRPRIGGSDGKYLYIRRADVPLDKCVRFEDLELLP